MIRGSFYYYQYKAGSFMAMLARAIMLADSENLKKMELVFPDIVAAYKCKDHSEPPLIIR